MNTKVISAAEVPGFDKLTPKEQAFVLHPDVFHDPKKAALEVGYSSSTIEKRAHSMRQRLMRFIRPRFEATFAKLGVDRRRIEEELACIAFTTEDDFKERVDIEMPDGGFQTVVVWKDPTSLPEHMRRAIKAVEYGTTVDADGNQHQSDRPTHVVLYSKEKALRELAGLFSDVAPKNPDDEQHALFDNLSPKERETIVRLYTVASRRAADKSIPIEGTHAPAEETPVRRITSTSGVRNAAPRDPDRSRARTRDQPPNSASAPARRRVEDPTEEIVTYVPLDHGDDDDAGYEDTN